MVSHSIRQVPAEAAAGQGARLAAFDLTGVTLSAGFTVRF